MHYQQLHYICTEGVNKDATQNGKFDDKPDRTAHKVKSGQITSPDRLFNDLALMICDKYMEIGVELGLKRKSLYNELETGLFAMKRGNEKAVKMLEMWQQFTSEDHFTYSVLANALKKYGFNDAAREFCYTKATSNLRSNLQKCIETHGGPTLDSRRNPSLTVASKQFLTGIIVNSIFSDSLCQSRQGLKKVYSYIYLM